MPLRKQNNAHVALIRFVLEKAEDAPVRQRIQLYRALADITGDAAETRDLESLASALESAENQSQQFVFQFIQKTNSLK